MLKPQGSLCAFVWYTSKANIKKGLTSSASLKENLESRLATAVV